MRAGEEHAALRLAVAVLRAHALTAAQCGVGFAVHAQHAFAARARQTVALLVLDAAAVDAHLRVGAELLADGRGLYAAARLAVAALDAALFAHAEQLLAVGVLPLQAAGARATRGGVGIAQAVFGDALAGRQLAERFTLRGDLAAVLVQAY